MKAVLAVVAVLVLAPSAHAAGWSTPRVFGAGAETAPRGAVSPDGSSLVAWVTKDRRLLASTGDRRGRFSAPVTVARRMFDYAVAPGAVAYEAKDGIHVAVRAGRRFRDRRIATSSGQEINSVTIAADPAGGWVVAESQFPRRGRVEHARALTLDARGRLLGSVQDLGPGQFGADARQTGALAVLPDGRAVLTFTRERAETDVSPTPVVVTTRPHGGTFSEPIALSTEDLFEPRVTVAGGQAVVSATAIAGCGDTGCSGAPRMTVLGADGTPGPLTGPAIAKPRRSFVPWGARNTLVFLVKTGVQPFSKEAPVRAWAGGALQTLTSEQAHEPVALPLAGGRVLALWATRQTLGAALAGPSGRFHRVRAPSGPGPDLYHFNPTNRDVRTAGRYALVAWSRGSTVRVSVRRF